MSRIADKFTALRAEQKKGFIPFVTAGDPDIETSLQILRAIASYGADIIELGVPFSDPMADGPTIQRSSQRALKKGINLASVLDLVREFRQSSDIPIVLFGYLNPFWRFGLETLRNQASVAGVDGILITDIVGEEFDRASRFFAEKEIDMISLIAPTTTDQRLESISGSAKGFIYAVSRAGVTGAQEQTSSSAEELVRRVRQFTSLPVAVGFGISTRAQIEDVWRYADAAVVGSAIVSEIEGADGIDVIPALDKFLEGLVPPTE
jgi:tryptophan synthase alpha chain